MTTTDTARAATRAALATRTLIVVSIVLLGAILYTVVTVAADTNETVSKVRSTQVDSRQTLDLIRSCTTPAGECAQRGNEQTADAIEQIVSGSRELHLETRRYAAVAAACADRAGPQTTRQIAACIRQEIQP